MQRHSKLSFLIVAGFLFAPAAVAQADTWPRLREDHHPVCAKALKIAEAAFRSKELILYQTRTIPSDIGTSLAIWRADPRSAQTLSYDSTAFEEIVPADNKKRRSLYWMRTTQFGQRFALSDRAFSWQGDWFEGFAVREKTTSAELQADIDASHDGGHVRLFEPLLHQEWNPPMFLREAATKEVWAMRVGHPADALSPWEVFTLGPDGPKSSCLIQFRPDVQSRTHKINPAWQLLPNEVRRLAELVDGTLGSGENEGTSNPTAARRIGAGHAWADAALRPWVFADDPPDRVRDLTDALLADWSKKARSFRLHAEKISRQRPLAEAALAALYREKFDYDETKSVRLATQAIDASVGATFAF